MVSDDAIATKLVTKLRIILDRLDGSSAVSHLTELQMRKAHQRAYCYGARGFGWSIIFVVETSRDYSAFHVVFCVYIIIGIKD
jgi:hypothetical protein